MNMRFNNCSCASWTCIVRSSPGDSSAWYFSVTCLFKQRDAYSLDLWGWWLSHVKPEEKTDFSLKCCRLENRRKKEEGWLSLLVCVFIMRCLLSRRRDGNSYSLLPQKQEKCWTLKNDLFLQPCVCVYIFCVSDRKKLAVLYSWERAEETSWRVFWGETILLSDLFCFEVLCLSQRHDQLHMVTWSRPMLPADTASPVLHRFKL